MSGYAPNSTVTCCVRKEDDDCIRRSRCFPFRIKGGKEETYVFIDGLKVFSLLANAADVKSLVIHPYDTTHAEMSPEQLEAAGIYQNTIRLSIGTEHIDDIIWDQEQGFAAAAKK